MGPDNSYLLQYDADVSHFWADRQELALGACFEPVSRQRAATIIPRQIVTEVTGTPRGSLPLTQRFHASWNVAYRTSVHSCYCLTFPLC